MSTVLPTTADARRTTRGWPQPETESDGSLEPWLALATPRPPAPVRPGPAMRAVTLSAEEWAWLFPVVGLSPAEPATPAHVRKA